MANSKFSIRSHYLTAFWCTLVIAIGLIVTGFFTPPKAQIDGSVLEATGLLFLWPALAFGAKALEEGKTATISHGNTTIEIKKEDEEYEEPVKDEDE